MSIIRSDNFFFTNPKPPQDYERRFNGTTYVDWTSTTELNAALDISFRKNKYFWIGGIYYECDDDGTTYRAIGGPGTQGTTKYAKVPVITTANTIEVAALADATVLIMVVMNKVCYQDFVDDGNQISFSGTTLDMTNAGGVYAGGWLVIFYQ